MLPAWMIRSIRPLLARQTRQRLLHSQISLDDWLTLHVSRGYPPPCLFNETISAFRVTCHEAIVANVLADPDRHPGLRRIH